MQLDGGEHADVWAVWVLARPMSGLRVWGVLQEGIQKRILSVSPANRKNARLNSGIHQDAVCLYCRL